MPSSKKNVVFPVRLDAATMARFEGTRKLWRKKSVPQAAIDSGFPLVPASEFMRFIVDTGLTVVEQKLNLDKENS